MPIAVGISSVASEPSDVVGASVGYETALMAAAAAAALRAGRNT